MMLEGKSGIVTGAAGGLGQAVAERLCAEGARIALVDVKTRELEATAAALRQSGLEAIAIAADISDEADTERMVQAAEDAFGRIDFIHQNAAVQIEKLLHETSAADWDRLMAVNLRSMFLGARAVIPRMMASGGGAIVNSGSVLSFTADQILPAYGASKHGVLGLTRAIAVTEAYAQAGIRCNCICPGDIRTPMVERYWQASADPSEARARTVAHYPGKRIASPAEVADAVCFLVSDRSAFINGAEIVIDGGVTAKCY
ncbi:MAG: SDR family NAD(P)-dependent oxidoreductase [Parvibaculaceae bacterium]